MTLADTVQSLVDALCLGEQPQSNATRGRPRPQEVRDESEVARIALEALGGPLSDSEISAESPPGPKDADGVSGWAAEEDTRAVEETEHLAQEEPEEAARREEAELQARLEAERAKREAEEAARREEAELQARLEADRAKREAEEAAGLLPVDGSELVFEEPKKVGFWVGFQHASLVFGDCS